MKRHAILNIHSGRFFFLPSEPKADKNKARDGLETSIPMSEAYNNKAKVDRE